MNLCVYESFLGEEIEALNGRSVNGRHIAIHLKNQNEALIGCHVIFIASSVLHKLAHVIDSIKGQPALTVLNSKGATYQGVMI